MLAVFGLFGYGLRKLGVDPSPLVVALVLGPMMEKTLRQALFISRCSVVDILARPLTIGILAVPAAAFVVPLLLRTWSRRRDSAVEAQSR